MTSSALDLCLHSRLHQLYLGNAPTCFCLFVCLFVRVFVCLFDFFNTFLSLSLSLSVCLVRTAIIFFYPFNLWSYFVFQLTEAELLKAARTLPPLPPLCVCVFVCLFVAVVIVVVVVVLKMTG